MVDELKNKIKIKFMPVKKKAIRILVLILVAIIVFGAGVFTGITTPWKRLARQ